MRRPFRRYDKAYLAELLAQETSIIINAFRLTADEFPLNAIEAIHDEACKRLQVSRSRDNLELELLTSSYL